MELLPHTGPSLAPSSRPDQGMRTSTPWRYAVSAADPAANKVDRVERAVLREESHVIGPGSTLSYFIFPAFAGNDSHPAAGYGACAAAVDLVLDDGARLSDTALADQYGFGASARAQGESKGLVPDQWNIRTIDLSPLAGRTVTAIEAAVHLPAELVDATLEGWLDDVELRTVAAPPEHRRPSEHVLTTRGTHSSGGVSRGNTLPATAVPYGFNFLTPCTDARTTQWVYAYHQHDVAPGVSALQALSISHQPSPWMNDYSVLQFMPGSSAGTPNADPAARALTFRHANEEATAHRYRVALDNGLVATAAPTDHAVALRFEYPGEDATLLLDQLDNNGSLTITTTSDGLPVLSGYVDGSENSTALRMYFYATADRPVTDSGMRNGGHGDVAGWVRFALGGDRTVNVRAATSFIGIAQARHSLELEIPAGDTVDEVSARAQQLWDDRLGVIAVQGASADQLTTLYSNLYRMFLYPNSAAENAGTATEPKWQYASFLKPADAHGSEFTGAQINPGSTYVNNGFWDTYRTEWPALCLLDPEQAGNMLDGFVEHYRDGGWTPRWSAPGYSDCMVGTSSDLVFADAAINGVGNFDLAEAYDSALRNATVPSDASAVGRKGLDVGIFAGYIPSDATHEAMSWSLENAISDYGVARYSELLLERASVTDPRRAEYAANAAYFANRARGYRLLFDPAVDFFQGRDSAGAFSHTPDTFDPRVWGHDYTETNAWGMAFSVPQDGAGLAELYGGRKGLEAKLDAYFGTPETARHEFKGSYWDVIHEMVEARNIRMGMFGISNQPAHHAPFMYAFTDAPHKLQAITRESVARLFTGSEIGQGYPGDEDNGEMSAWYVFAALGFYPLSLASGGFIITSPLYESATVRLATGTTIGIKSLNHGAGNVYIQSLSVNGAPWESTFIDHATLAAGGTLEFVMGAEPSAWGSAPGEAPPSLDAPGASRAPTSDLTSPGGAFSASVSGAELLFNNTSADALSMPDGGWAAYAFDAPTAVSLYTVTAGPELTDWVLEGSNDGDAWSVLDSRSGETFRWERQTRPFQLPDADFASYRLRVAGAATLYQLELFAGL